MSMSNKIESLRQLEKMGSEYNPTLLYEHSFKFWSRISGPPIRHSLSLPDAKSILHDSNVFDFGISIL